MPRYLASDKINVALMHVWFPVKLKGKLTTFDGQQLCQTRLKISPWLGLFVSDIGSRYCHNYSERFISIYKLLCCSTCLVQLSVPVEKI